MEKTNNRKFVILKGIAGIRRISVEFRHPVVKNCDLQYGYEVQRQRTVRQSFDALSGETVGEVAVRVTPPKCGRCGMDYEPVITE